MNASRYFAEDYQDARKKFLEAAEAAGAELDHFRHPSERGPDGGALYLDTAWFGPKDASTVLLALSGTHGAEGFCGSAAQLLWIKEKRWRGLPQGVAVLKVHAVNPFGFAHWLRVNESNVDLNRNWIDFDRPWPKNPIFDEVEKALPKRDGYDDELVDQHMAALAPLYKKHGDWAMADALSRGQYDHPNASQFGGQKREWSSLTLEYVLRTKCASARHFAYIDWHSLVRIGDGKFVYLCFNETGDPLFKRVGSWWGAAAIDRKTVDRQWGEGIARSERRPSRNGLVMWGLQHVLAPKADLAGGVIEFCADAEPHNDPLRHRVRQSLKARYLFKHRRFEGKEAKAMVAELREGCCPTRRDWQEKALEAALDTYDRTLQGAGLWAKENPPAEPGKLLRSSSFV